MKTIKILLTTLIVFGFTQCRSSKFDQTPPFKILKATYTNWMGGQPSVKSTKVEIHLSKSNITSFNTLYFNKQKANFEIIKLKEKTVLIAHFNTSIKRDIILNADPTKELKNEFPISIKLPFELKKDEAIISYKENNNIRYFKLKNLKEVK
ncbi:hypothetical protein [Polaribacter aquimarinus]|uniref:Uncharacterized protein n=1 Tax=Polaribacter aquimarinus TaxID=2100726 RepID=A0A2U2JBV2_9FLAO|nr:hypothetical protein [Polaribacter aquimarinus]PWG05819.1 hypothetical protein DIS07_05090 [Polaribacter aquimarinus]